jgi:hypothetical protein
VLAFFMGGLNETFTALELSLLICAAVLAFVWKSGTSNRGLSAFLVAGVVGAILGFLIVVGAPGNAVRQAFYPSPPSPFGIFWIAVQGFAQYLAGLFSRFDRLTAMIGAIALSFFVGLQAPLPRIRIWLVPALLAAGLAFAFVCFLPSAYGLSDVPPDRTLMMPAYLLALALILSSYLAGGIFHLRVAAPARRTALEAGLLGIAALACFTSVFLTNRHLLESGPAFASYASNWDSVNASITAAHEHGQTVITIHAMPNWADLDEPNDNPKFWVNVCYREYYGIEVLAESQP